MAPSAQEHARQRQKLLFQKLLNQREGASPLTLVLDSLEQPAAPIINEFAIRAKKAARAKIIHLAFGTLKKHPHADVHVNTRNKTLAAVRAELLRHYPTYDPKQKTPPQRALVILDSLNPIATSAPDSLPAFLSNIVSPTASLVAVYHTDVPLIPSQHAAHNEYAPPPLAVLTHLATAVLKLSNLEHEIARQKARDRSVQEPEFGLAEGREGVLIGLREKRTRGTGAGLVVDMEVRRRSGRGVTGKFVVSMPAPAERRKGAVASFCLLEAHPAFAPPEVEAKEDEEPESTFNLGLTEKQRKDREGVVLPYFDAQTDIGAGEGGRILYEMVREDDFDEEEDEI